MLREGAGMFDDDARREGDQDARHMEDSACTRGLSRRGFLGAGAILGLAAMTLPAKSAFAWSSWTNATSEMLKDVGMGDCVHEDLVQIAYARLVRNHAADGASPASLLNPWAGALQGDARFADVAGDTVDRGEGMEFAGADDLAARLFRENLAYLRIGSFWNDAAADTLLDFGASCWFADSIPQFSGNDYYEGAWGVGQHIRETNEANKDGSIVGLDALVQFTMNDRNNFIHGMLTSTASHKQHLRQAEVKQFALQWLGVAYEYARTGQVTATNDVTSQQAEQIFKGFIDTYEQLDDQAHNMCVSLQVGAAEASMRLPRRRLRLRALGMMCHTMEDLWCPAHTCRTYHEGGSIPKNSILAFCNYKLQNGDQMPMSGYHIPFDRYAVSDASNPTNWREALTRGDDAHAGTEKLSNVLDDSMACLDDAHTCFNTLGMNEAIACITTLFEFFYRGTAWDDGVRQWVDTEVMPTCFDANGQSYICDAGRRSLHTPTYIISPLWALKRAYRKMGLAPNFNQMISAARGYDAWQRGAHRFYSGKYNTSQSSYITAGHEGDSIWDDAAGESRLVELVDKIHAGYSSLSSKKQRNLLELIGCNGCHDMVSAIGSIAGMLQEFNIDLRGSLRPSGDAALAKLEEARRFFESGLSGSADKAAAQALVDQGLLAAGVAYADEGDVSFMTSNMALEDVAYFDDGSYLIAMRDMESLETSIMAVPAHTPGKDKLEEEGIANLTITYTLQKEFDGDPDYLYIVSDIDYSDMEEDVYLVTGWVKSVSEDGKSLVLDLNGISEFELDIRDDVTSVPQVGAYICARYALGPASIYLVDYDEVEDPGKLVKATYPVAEVAGSSMWLLVNGGASDAKDGHREYLRIDYGSADVRALPQEGYEAVVYYHDEVYGDLVDAGASNLAGSADSAVSAASSSLAGAGSSNGSAPRADDNMDDSATPGYLELGDEYDNLSYGSEVFHVANVIAGTNQAYDDRPSEEGDTPQGSKAGGEQPARPAAATPGGTKASSTATAKTDDERGGLGGVLSVAAVAGAALAAYSARRVANERQGLEEGQ